MATRLDGWAAACRPVDVARPCHRFLAMAGGAMSTCAMSSSIPFGSVDDPPMAMVVAVVVASGGQGGGGEVAWSAPGAAHRQQLCGPNTEGPRMVCARSHSSPTDRRPRDRGGRTGVGRDRRQRGRPVVQSSASHTTCPWMVTICKRQWRSRRHGQLVSLSAPVGKEWRAWSWWHGAAWKQGAPASHLVHSCREFATFVHPHVLASSAGGEVSFGRRRRRLPSTFSLDRRTAPAARWLGV